MTTPDEVDRLKRAAAEAAFKYLRPGQTIGLGTGSTARHFILALGEKVKAGFRIRGVPTSHETAELARSQHIPLLDGGDDWEIDVAVDGADQIDPRLNLIKGGGGALLKEKIVAAAARQFIVVADETKLVPVLAGGFPLPIEVATFGWLSTARLVEAASAELGCSGKAVLRGKGGQRFRTEAGNYILDLHLPRIEDPATWETRLNEIPGVVETGLFVGRAQIAIIASAKGVEERQAGRL
jgi:ribose 5-phosphate isomerase A